MNLNRSSGLRPISGSTSSSTRPSAWGRVTRARVRFEGSMVVSFSWAGIISPRPLKRLISGFLPLNSPASRSSRGAPARSDHLRHGPVEEGDQQAGDVGPVDIGVGHDHHAVVAQILFLELRSG